VKIIQHRQIPWARHQSIHPIYQPTREIGTHTPPLAATPVAATAASPSLDSSIQSKIVRSILLTNLVCLYQPLMVSPGKRSHRLFVSQQKYFQWYSCRSRCSRCRFSWMMIYDKTCLSLFLLKVINISFIIITILSTSLLPLSSSSPSLFNNSGTISIFQRWRRWRRGVCITCKLP